MARPYNNPNEPGFFSRVHGTDLFESWDLVLGLRTLERRLDALEQDR